ncbi:MAG TPA: hypothetical protein VK579_19495 [Terriglobales bacterium]|nr:hypothetical protein [Terriglobales bacterium]
MVTILFNSGHFPRYCLYISLEIASLLASRSRTVYSQQRQSHRELQMLKSANQQLEAMASTMPLHGAMGADPMD